jgi:hypothetical protein
MGFSYGEPNFPSAPPMDDDIKETQFNEVDLGDDDIIATSGVFVVVKYQNKTKNNPKYSENTPNFRVPHNTANKLLTSY